MKFIVAIIKPFKLTDVKEALDACGITRMTVAEVKGFGRQKGHSELYRGSEYQIDFMPKVRLDIAIEDEQLDDAIEAIESSARTDTIGDGKIFVFDLIDALRIRTGERGEDAL
ncbi:MAG: Nitrogen regulatory protein P-II 2 [candidate division BRC1 bacterium ADurb.BinA364]|nr:MAG: Nitrogen regulatory protein P-II 2 [candidate division BRC1 bacterium ADurb.BinA364]